MKVVRWSALRTGRLYPQEIPLEPISLSLTFMGLGIVSISYYRCNVVQFTYIWKLRYMFRVVPPPIIRSANNCIYNIWYLSDRYCYLPL